MMKKLTQTEHGRPMLWMTAGKNPACSVGLETSQMAEDSVGLPQGLGRVRKLIHVLMCLYTPYHTIPYHTYPHTYIPYLPYLGYLPTNIHTYKYKCIYVSVYMHMYM